MSGPVIRWTRDQKEVFAFTENLCVLAGAGTGKTMTLVEFVLRLLSGEIKGVEGLELSHILALTYTEKAAQEMRNRLRLAVNEIIREAGTEPVQREFWIRQRRTLDRAQISTIHSFCLHLLRQYALQAGLDQDFHLEDQITDLENETVRETLLDLIEARDSDLLNLLDHFPWMSLGRGIGVGDFMADLVDRARTLGSAPEPAEAEPISLDDQVQALTEAARIINDLIQAKELTPQKSYYQKLAGFASAVRDLTRRDQPAEEILSNLNRIKKFLKKDWYVARKAKKLANAAVEALETEQASRQARPLKQSLMGLAERFDQSFEQAKANRFALDFNDLLLKAREILDHNPEVRNALKRRFKVVLVDEFQDTNRLQADILAYLLEPPGQAELPVRTPAYKGLKKARRRLIIFGDPKQSIYRFRGAEVDVFQSMKRSLKRVNLEKNFRSQKRLIEFFNAFFQQVMPEASGLADDVNDYVATYGPEDRQEWRRKDLAAAPAVEILEFEPGKNMQENRRNEAEALAARIKDILSARAGVLVSDEGRSPGPGDLTILLRRFTHLKAYEQALRRADLPYYTVRGRGFYECQEIWDLINLVLCLAHPLDGTALLGVLRSPLAGVSDET
ncbi:MAG: UvrD-helicase domain-containing protein, partial [Deltaproteobacteria bacterium]|nr:UvrD-helicase domain-containing protein [Deltaproteobacteria bacterium]